jgi:hypothetical protein
LAFLAMMPNKSPEPTPVGAVSSAVAVDIASPAWLTLLSLGGSVLIGFPLLLN